MAARNPDALKLAKDFSYPGFLFSIARLPKSNRLFVGSSDFRVLELDASGDKLAVQEIGKHESYVTSTILAGKTLISGGYDGKLHWWDVDAKKPIRSVDAHGKWIRKCAASPDGRQIVSVADDMIGKLWDAVTGKLLLELRGHAEKTPHHFGSMLYCATFSPDGKHIATADKIGQVIVWDAATGKEVARVSAPIMYTWDPTQRIHSIGGVRSLAFSPDGKLLAVGGMGKVGNIDHLEGKARIEVFDWAAGKQTHEFPGDSFKGLVEHLHFDETGSWLLGAGGAGDGFLMFYDLKTKKTLRQEKVATHVHDLTCTEDGSILYAVGFGKIYRYTMM